jgi:hypothetical protein
MDRRVPRIYGPARVRGDTGLFLKTAIGDLETISMFQPANPLSPLTKLGRTDSTTFLLTCPY